MEAIILAGGLGTRLKSAVSDIPKPLAQVGGRPFLFFVLDWLYRCGVTHAVLAVGYRAEDIVEACKDKYSGISLDYSIETAPLGTGGAIKQAMGFCREQDVIIVNGDTMFDVELDMMLSFHRGNAASLTVALKAMDVCDRYGTVSISGTKIASYNEKKPCSRGLINGGVYIMNRHMAKLFPEGAFSFEKAILEDGSIEKHAFLSGGYFVDIGTPEDYERAKTTLEGSLTGRVRKALFLDRDGTLNVDKHHLYKKEDLEFIPGMPQLIESYRSEGYLVIVVTNQAGVAKGLYTEQEVKELHSHINERLLKEYNTCVDAFFYCPHHPEGTVPKYAVTCGCRKPAPGLIYEAVFYFMEKGIRLDLPSSILIGDKDSDLQAGKAAGVGFQCGV